ncbi:PIN domain-containing protein [Microcoleus sp. Pol17_C1]|uniref:PIN domain-containing protein n=1 Tax=unclassified Microcoleus TaxID=2642155 RepID=UPI002FD6898D
MEVVSVILDSCVIFPMPLCDTLLRAAEAELYEVHFSQEILDGATRNLVKKGRMTEVKAARFQEVIKNTFPEAIIEVPASLVEAMTNHPGDRHVVAAAIVANAKVIVTDNLKHFPKEALEPYDIEAQHPDVFLTELFDNDPESMIEVIRQQVEDLKNPPHNVAEIIERLEKNNRVHEFASKVRFYEYCDFIIETAKKAVRKIGEPSPEGGRCYEGEKYRLWMKGQIIRITAKDGRGEIMLVQNEEIEGDISAEDIKLFQIFAQRLDEELTINQIDEQQAN